MKLKADLDWSLKPFISIPMLWRDNLKAQTKFEAIDSKGGFPKKVESK